MHGPGTQSWLRHITLAAALTLGLSAAPAAAQDGSGVYQEGDRGVYDDWGWFGENDELFEQDDYGIDNYELYGDDIGIDNNDYYGEDGYLEDYGYDEFGLDYTGVPAGYSDEGLYGDGGLYDSYYSDDWYSDDWWDW